MGAFDEKPLVAMTVEELERAVEYHDYQYWVLAKPLIADADYDLLVRRLEELRPDSPVLRRVGGGFATETFRNKVEHSAPMLSLDKCYDEEKYFAWLKTTVGRSLKNVLQEGALTGEAATRYAAFARVEREDELPELVAGLEVAVSPKIDGVAASLKYDGDGNLALAATRGDGVVGEDFTLNARLIPSIPWKVAGPGIEVRGEVYMKRSVFERKYAGSFPNSRNLTAGTLKQKESNRAQLLDLSFLAYDLLRDASGGAGADTEAGKRELLAKLGFEPVPTRLARARDVPPLFGELLKGREGWEFDADGVVVKLNDVLLQAALGVTAHHPRGAIAFKFQGDLGLTTIDEVEWSVSRSAVITPVARVAPVFLSGARVSRSTLHNVKEFNKLALKRGDRVEVKRRGDVIPKVEANLGGGSEPFPVPVSCPSCGSPTLLASPQLFVAGARLARFADREQLLALVRHMKEISASAGLFSLTDTCNSAARKEGDIRYKEALTWKKGDGEARKAILERLGRLPLLRCRQPEISLLLVLDPDLPAALELLGLVAPLVEPERLELRLLPVGESRYEGAAMSPLFERLAAAGRAGRFWEEAGEAIPSPGTRRENGAWTESASQDWTELAYQLADDFLVCARPESCPEVILSTLEHFVQTLGVEGFGRKIIENLHRAGLLKEREDFFRLEPGTLVALERMGDVLAAKLVDRVQETRTLPLSLFLMSLGVDELARHASTILEKEYGSLERVLALTEADLMKHESIAFGIAHQVVHGLRRKRRQIERLRPHVRIAAPAPAAAPDRTLPFSGRSFVFTGKMKTMGRKEAQAMVQKLGGEIPDGVTVDLSFLVVGDEGSPLFGEGAKGSKLVKAEKYVAAGASLRIISETQFLEMLRESGWSG